MEREFTATTYVVHNGKFLFVYHEKLQKWLPPGGHIEPNETPEEAAVREVLEETGVHIELLKQENIWIREEHAKSLARPFVVLLEKIPQHKERCPHEHIDLVYVGRPKDPLPQELGPHIAEWFTLHELKQMHVGKDLFPEAIETAECVLAFVREVVEIEAL